jgi:type I restriction enzyme S subunit
MYASSAEARQYEVVPGDLVVSEGGDVGRAEFVPDVPPGTIIQNSLHRVRTQLADIRFIRYSLSAIYNSGWLAALCNKATFAHLTRGKLTSLPIPHRTLRAQRAIADYLDQETGRIDALVTHKRRMIELLSEAQPVAASMDLLGTIDGPGSRHASWPVSWERMPFRWLFKEVDERSADGSEELMSVSQTRGVIPQAELGERRQFAETLAGYKICRKDDLVINRMWVYYGALGVAPALGLVSPDYSVFRSRGQLRADLASHILRTPPYVGEMTRLVRGVGSAFQGAVRKPRLHPRELGQIVMPVPPMEEQEGLIGELVRHRNQLGERGHLIERSVALLQERRHALISAVVTGQLEIPEAA